MLKKFLNNIINIAAILLVAMFFSCGNKLQEVEDFLAEKNLPIGEAKDVNLIYTDSGKVKTKLITPLMYDFSNRKDHPYTEFPKGIKIITYDEKGDSVTLKADYAITFTKTKISEAINNVLILNHAENSALMTDQLFWDSGEHFIYTEKDFTLISKKDTINGKGLDANEDLTKINMKSVYGTVYVNESE
ncbi:MAG: LPS export ABC transporter periplasmic protein LptC [Bacteroidota bacterium]